MINSYNILHSSTQVMNHQNINYYYDVLGNLKLSVQCSPPVFI